MSATYNILIDIGSDYADTFTFYSDACKTTTIDLTDYAFKAQIRSSFTSATVIEEIVISTVNAATGQIDLTISAADTLPLTAGSYYWDLRVTDGDGAVDRWVSGSVTISGTVTR